MHISTNNNIIVNLVMHVIIITIVLSIKTALLLLSYNISGLMIILFDSLKLLSVSASQIYFVAC